MPHWDSGPLIRLRSASPPRRHLLPQGEKEARLPRVRHSNLAVVFIHSGKLRPSRGAQCARGMLPVCPRGGVISRADRGPGGVDPRQRDEGDGAPSGAACPFSARLSLSERRGAFRRAVQRLSRRRAALCPWFVPPRLRPGFRGAFRVNRSIRVSGGPSRPTVSELLAGTRSGPGRSPGAARVRGLRDHARGRRPAPHEPAQPVRAPHGERAGWNMVLDYGGIMS